MFRTTEIMRYVKRGRITAVLVSAVIVGFSGCGENSDRAPVVGTVTFEGQPVTGGTLTFVPMVAGQHDKSGKPATGTIQMDGHFVLGTDTEDDGAIIANHTVAYSPPVTTWEAPEWDGRGKPPVPPASPYDGLVVKTVAVQVHEGENTIDIELQAVPKKPMYSSRMY